MSLIRHVKSLFTKASMSPSPQVVTVSKPDANLHVREFLKFYLSFGYAPEFAVLLNGAWGIGKTYLMKRILDDHFSALNAQIDRENSEETDSRKHKENDRYIYVSLYGKKSIKEIDNAVLAELYPMLTGKVARLFTNLTTGALKKVGVTPDMDVNEFLNKFNGNVYVFDDLERCPLPVQEIMGYINEFVEHKQKKVIIIANEDELKKNSTVKEDYLSRREKTIGKTLEVQPSHEEAYAFFLKKISDPETRNYLEGHSAMVLSIFERSRFNNLRILQQTLWDFERFFQVIQPERRAKTNGIEVVSQLFLALSLEVKAGKLGESDLVGRRMFARGLFGDKARTEAVDQFTVSAEKYNPLELSDGVLNGEVLKNLLFRGIVNPQQIDASLAAAYHFQEPGDEAPWRTIWNIHERTNAEIDYALVKLQTEFDARKFIYFGEILQVFGVRIWASSNSLLPLTLEEVVATGKAYLDDLYKLGHLAQDVDYLVVSMSGWDGLEFLEKATPQFNELFQHYKSLNERAIRDQYPAWAESIFEDIKAGNPNYIDRLTQSKKPPEGFYNVPVLASINPVDFVEAIYALTPTLQRHVFTALGGRYQHGSLANRLAGEQKWVGEINAELSRRLDQEVNKLNVARFQRFMGWGMNGWIANLTPPSVASIDPDTARVEMQPLAPDGVASAASSDIDDEQADLSMLEGSGDGGLATDKPQ